MAEEYDYLFKSIVVGDGGVGKTALTLRFSKGFFTEDYKMTIGVDFHVKTISIDTSEGPLKCKLQLWDTGGQERFSSIRPMYYRGSLGTILVFDLTNSASFEHLPQWIEEVRTNIKAEIPVLLVGNKSDLIDQRVVSIEEISKFTHDFNLYYIETSAKTGEGVGDCFYILACLMIGQGVPEQLIANTTVYTPGNIPKGGGQISASISPSSELKDVHIALPVPEPKLTKLVQPAPLIEPETELFKLRMHPFELKKKQTEEHEVKIGNKERILNLLKFTALTSKEIAEKLNISEKNTRTYILRLKKEGKIKSINKKGRFLIYTHQRPPISSNQYNEIGVLEDDLNYLLNLIERKMTPKDGVKFTPTDLMNIRRIEERIADKIGGNLKAREVVKDLIDFEQSFKEEINEKIAKLEEKVDFITFRKIKSIKDEKLEATKISTPEPTEIEFKTPDEIMIKEVVKSELTTLFSDDKVYKPKKIPITYISRVPTPPPKEFVSSYSEKSITGYESPFRVIKREELPKRQPILGILSSPSLIDYMPQTIITKTEKKKKAKEKKKQDKEKAKIEKEKKIIEKREKQENIIEVMKKSKKDKKEKQLEPTKSKPSQTPAPIMPKPEMGSLFQTITQKTEDLTTDQSVPFKPFTGESKTKEEGKSKLRIIPNVADIGTEKLDPKFFKPKTVTASSKMQGVRKKEKKTVISLDDDRIDLKGGNEYVKFCGITSVGRTPLFATNKKLHYLLELTNNLDFIATSILGGDLDKMLLKSENDETEKCQFLEKNNIIYILYGKFPDKKGKWVLEQMANYFSDIVGGKDVNNLSKIDKFNIEKKFKVHLLSIFKQFMQLEDVFTDQEIPYVDDWLRLDYVGLSSMSIGVISILLDDEEKLNVEVPGEFEDPAEEVEMKESLLTAKIEAIAANTLGNTGAYPRWIAVKLGFQQYRFLTFKKYKNNYFLSCLSEGNLKKIEEVEAKLEPILHHGINTPFSGNLRPFNKLKATIKDSLDKIF